ncbi:hypothetical protein [Paludisphaera borealis]|uniref:hypothetical protein n=1 Tax=Paludisphaera borealis TaxID=1387353 RepID=UPI0009710BD5|nr:hypothetical protein [Paludisphaera borealis]
MITGYEPEAPASAAGLRPDRMILPWDHDAAVAADSAMSALEAAPDLYLQGGKLVEFTPTSETPRLQPLDQPRIREHLDRRVGWFNVATGRTISPPPSVLSLVLARAPDGRFPVVRGVLDAPTIRPDGSILSVPGYDPLTGLILAPNIVIEPTPANPSLEDARAAWERLRGEVLVDFPFRGDIDRAVALASLLTLVGRPTYSGPTPLFGVSANRRGTGKDLLVRSLATIAAGRPLDSSPPPESNSEMRRRITAMARSGVRVVLLGNVTEPLGGAALEDAMTTVNWTDRVLNQSTMTPSLTLSLTWFATGNNLRTKGDFARRMLPIHLASADEFPEMRTGFRHDSLLAHVAADRASLLRDCLVILRAFHVAGRPEPPTRLGSFEAWSEAIAGAVHWVTGVDPIAAQAAVVATDVGEDFRRRLIEGWAAIPGGTEGLTVRDAVAAIQTRDDLAGFREALEAEFATSDPRVLKRKLGNHLRTLYGCVVDGRVLTKVGRDGVQNVARWAVRPQTL